MTFTSLQFYAFLPIVYLVFYFTIDRWRWLVLLVASYGFYASFKAPYLLAVLFMVTIISYACGLRIGSHHDEGSRKLWLRVGIIACVAILALLKYLPFLETQTNSLFGFSSPLFKTIISIGVSYFTFQAISYLADIYLEIEEPEKHFGHFALYMAFFPKLLQGPIERAGDLLPQLKQPYQFDYDVMRSGMLLFTWGLFKKVVVADRLAIFVNTVYIAPREYSGLSLLIATYLYAFQLYFDFSAYTDMARGVARIFNIQLVPNFNSPYLATSVADFWRRWHMSFSRWILDYIFKPLQMQWRNWGNWGTAVALLITFLISGVWHGAAMGFVVWGGLHGIFLAVSVFIKPYQKKIHKLLGIEKSVILRYWQIFITFNLASFAWIFFRANNLDDAFYIITHLTTGPAISAKILAKVSEWKTDIAVVVAASAVLYLAHIVYRKSNKPDYLFSKPPIIRWTLYYVLVMAIIIFNVDSNSTFIYLQF